MKDLKREFTYNEHVILQKLMDSVAEPREVPDPYFTENFNYTYELVEKACEQLLTHIEQNDLI